jgi:ABC-type nitrate/sulfonate/bicarbonate transport system substrate-binding protein
MNPDGSANPVKVRGMSLMFGFGGKAQTTVIPMTKWLKAAGLNIKDVQVGAEVNSADGLIALQQGRVGGTWLLTPVWKLAPEKVPDARYMESSGFSLASYMMSKDFMASRPDVAKAILRATMRAQRTYLQGNYHADAKMVAAMAKATGAPETSITGTPALQFTTDLLYSKQAQQNMLDAQDAWFQVGGILQYPQPMTIDKMVDETLVKQVAAGQ